MSLERSTEQRQHWLVIFLIALIAISLVIIIIATIVVPIIKYQSRPTMVSFGIAPSTAKIVVDGKEYSHGASDIKAGSYTAEISADGFDTKNVNFEVKNHQTTVVNDFLNNKTSGLEYYKRSAADISTLRSLKDDSVVAFIKEYDQQLSIKDKLPIVWYNPINDSPNFSVAGAANVKIVDGTQDSRCDMDFCLLASGSTETTTYVKKAIEEAGYKFEDYEIIYE